jgi:FdhD protein
LPVAVRDDEVLDSDGVVVEDRPRRLHGSFRSGIEPNLPEVRQTFNLRPAIDELPEEQSLAIEINGRHVATLVCSPVGATELALGWAFAQGYFDDPVQVHRLTSYRDRLALMIDRPGRGGETWHGLVASGFDASSVMTSHRISGSSDETAGSQGPRFDRSLFLAFIERIFARFRADVCAEAIHHAAVTDGDHLCAVSRDVCRHNAVDKVVGWTLSQQLDRSRLILCLSGRVSTDLAYKAARAGFAIVASRSLPTNEAVEVAHAAGITLVGRVLDLQPAIYAHPWRLTDREDGL